MRFWRFTFVDLEADPRIICAAAPSKDVAVVLVQAKLDITIDLTQRGRVICAQYGEDINRTVPSILSITKRDGTVQDNPLPAFLPAG